MSEADDPAVIAAAVISTVFGEQTGAGLVITTAGVGLTVMVNVTGGPVQIAVPFVRVGVTEIVAIMGVIPAFTAVKGAILPEPLAARPIPGALLVHENAVVPKMLVVVKLTGAVTVPLQRIWFEGCTTCPDGL